VRKGVSLHDECAYKLTLAGVGACKAGYLFWPCFYIKLLVLWDANPDVLNRIACKLLPNELDLEEGGAYAWMWDLEDGDDTPASDYKSAADKLFTHVMCLTNRPRSDMDGLKAAVSHEALHITKAALDLRGLRWTKDSEEAYTYQLESIVYRVSQLLKTPVTRTIRV